MEIIILFLLFINFFLTFQNSEINNFSNTTNKKPRIRCLVDKNKYKPKNFIKIEKAQKIDWHNSMDIGQFLVYNICMAYNNTKYNLLLNAYYWYNMHNITYFFYTP